MGQSTEELTNQIAATRNDLSQDLDALQDRVSPSAIVERRKEAVRGRARSVREKVMGAAHTAQHSAGSAGGSVSGSVSGTVDSARDAASGAVSSAEQTIEGSPIAAGLVAFGAGLVIAGLIPASSAEARASQRVVETAKDKAQPLVQEAKSAGQQVASNLQESAVDHAQQVKASAQESAQHVKEEGTSSAQTVKEQAPGT